MKQLRNTIILLSLFIGLPFLSNGQFFEISKSSPDTARQYLEKYLNTFDNYINTPDRFAANRVEVLKMFRKRHKKQITNFVEKRKLFGKKLSPQKLLKRIPKKYPNGFGMHYVKDSVEQLQTRNGFFSNTYAYKIPMEYSGMRGDGSFLNYKKDQYFFVRAKSGNHQITGIRKHKYYKRKFKKQVYRTGLFLELSIVPVNAGLLRTHTIIPENDLFINDHTYFSTYFMKDQFTITYFKNIGINMVYMLRPWFGGGVYFAGSNYSSVISYEKPYEHVTYHQEWDHELQEYVNIATPYYENYLIIRGMGDRISAITAENFEQRYDVESKSMAGFVRFQGGGSLFSFSLDLGGGAQLKPVFTNYIDGKIKYFGINSNTGEPNEWDEQYGYGIYKYDNVKTHQAQGSRRWFALGRGNIHIQPSKLFNVRLSAGMQMFFKNFHKESWNMWDAYAIVPVDRIKKNGLNYHFTTEFAIGIHINEVLAKFNIL